MICEAKRGDGTTEKLVLLGSAEATIVQWLFFFYEPPVAQW